MFTEIKRFFSPPVFDDEDKNYLARILNIILLTLLLASILVVINAVLSGDQNLLIGVLLADIIVAASLWLLRRGHLTLASWLLPIMMWGFFTYLSQAGWGLLDPAIFGYTIVIALASLLLGQKSSSIFTFLSLVALSWTAYAQVNGYISVSPAISYFDLVNISIILIVLAVLLYVLISNLRDNLSRARSQERALIESNRKLQAIQTTLEDQIAARTQGLELVAALSERLSAILDVDQLLAELVKQVKTNFGYYHAQVYLMDEVRQHLILAAGAGEVGVQMKEQGHTISMDTPTSLVVRAARTNQIVIVDDVREVVDWLVNPLLPEARAEMAVPIVLDGQVVGVLDVQADEIARLDEGDAGILRSLANQVAVTIRNAHLFAQVETALAEARATQEQYLRQSWQTARSKTQEYHYRRPGAPTTVDEILKAELAEQAQLQDQPVMMFLDGEGQVNQETPALIAPIKLQDQVIGTMQFHETDSTHQQRWTEQEIALVRAIADQVAQTAENLRLFEETRDRAARERTIREITDKLRAAPNLERLATIAAEELGRQFSATHARLDLGLEAELAENGHGRDAT